LKENSPDQVAYLGIGSNLGDPAENCRKALERIAGCGSVRVLRKSSLYRTEPVGVADQPWFVNAAIEVRTSLEAHALFDLLQGIETEMGRVRLQKWGPRTIDLDILFYDQAIIRDEVLVVPHPELHKRRFVLEPLNEIAPYLIHPLYGISVKGLLDRLSDPGVVERIELQP
jgi:2-amino-4-hydroxy-6-hydroxymethyldihydropteridine diphosphokinase